MRRAGRLSRRPDFYASAHGEPPRAGPRAEEDASERAVHTARGSLQSYAAERLPALLTAEPIAVVQDLALILLVATPVALLSHYLRQPMMIAYILAGIIVSPYTPTGVQISNVTDISVLAEIGIVFLLLAVGLEFPLSRLRAIGRPAFVIALSEAMATFVAGFLVGRAFGFSTIDALFVGLAISVTSTVVVSRVLEELGVLQHGSANLVLGIVIIEDIITVSGLGILQSVAVNGGLSFLTFLEAIVLVVAFIAITLTVGIRFLPPLVSRLAKVGRPELLLIGVLGMTFGFAIASSFIGISVATGAFFAGVMVAESDAQPQVHRLVFPLKELFGAIFFISMGALMDILLIPQYLFPIAALIVTALAVKFLATYTAGRGMRIERSLARRTAITVSASGGEMALVVANGGDATGATSDFVLPLVGAMTIITTFLSPYLIRFAWKDQARDPASPPPKPTIVAAMES